MDGMYEIKDIRSKEQVAYMEKYQEGWDGKEYGIGIWGAGRKIGGNMELEKI